MFNFYFVSLQAKCYKNKINESTIHTNASNSGFKLTLGDLCFVPLIWKVVTIRGMTHGDYLNEAKVTMHKKNRYHLVIAILF